MTQETICCNIEITPYTESKKSLKKVILSKLLTFTVKGYLILFDLKDDLSLEIKLDSSFSFSGYPGKPMISKPPFIMNGFSVVLKRIGACKFTSQDTNFPLFYDKFVSSWKSKPKIEEAPIDISFIKQNFPKTPNNKSPYFSVTKRVGDSTPTQKTKSVTDADSLKRQKTNESPLNRINSTPIPKSKVLFETPVRSYKNDKIPFSNSLLNLPLTDTPIQNKKEFLITPKNNKQIITDSPVPLLKNEKENMDFVLSKPPLTLSQNKPASPIPAHKGFLNIGQSCYMNSVLQFLYYLNPIYPDNPFTKILLELYSQKETHQTVNPKSFKQNMSTLFNAFYHNKQEDAHEFLCYCSTYLSGIEWTLSKDISCKKCSYTNTLNETFFDLSISCSNRSLVDLVSEFFETEDIEWCCEQCSFDKGTIKKSIKNGPLILLIHLKRFRVGSFISKYVECVGIEERIDLTCYGGGVYVLKSIINHWGDTTDQGHYTCDVKSDGKWMTFDDANYSEHTHDIINERGTSWYILGYVKVE